MRYKVITKNVTNAYILDEQNNEIVSLCNTKRPDKGFESLERLVKYANEYVKANTGNELQVGDKVRIIDAMDRDYIGKIGIIEEISTSYPKCCKLNIDDKKGSWANAALFSCIEKYNN